MKQQVLFAVLTFFSLSLWAQSSDEAAVRKLLDNQVRAWNQGNIDEFMKGYWNSDSVTFVGKSGVTHGYAQVLANYKKNFADTAHMGKLFFTLLQVKELSAEYYFVIGKFFLKRTVGDAGGFFTLLFRKIRGKWAIVVDHTS